MVAAADSAASAFAAPDYAVPEALKKENLSQADYDEICRRLGRAPNRAELGMFGVMWSEHCCYRNSRPLLQGFPTTGPRILVGPGENAGVVDLGEGQRLAFKIESHNHPSAVEPFQGAATGVGGILRDIFTMGARPIALLNALRFGPLEDERNVGLMEGVVAGIAHYGNCVGVPTVGGEVAFDPSYSGNPLVNAMALGLMETEQIVCSGAEGVGYPVVYVGSTTGRDGMGGASFASAELTEASLDDRPAVQVGDPFLEKGLIEACLEAFQSGLSWLIILRKRDNFRHAFDQFDIEKIETLPAGQSVSGTGGGTLALAGGTLTLGPNLTTSGAGGTLTLSAGGSYTLTVPATGTAALGSGTTEQIAYWSSANVLAAAPIYYDVSNNRIGIKDSTPSYDLDVNATIRATSGISAGSPSTGATGGQVRAQGRIQTDEFFESAAGFNWDLGNYAAGGTITPAQGRVSISINGTTYYLLARTS